MFSDKIFSLEWLNYYDHLFVQITTDLSNDALIQLLLYGDQDLSYDLNKNILELTLRFIRKTGRFD